MRMRLLFIASMLFLFPPCVSSQVFQWAARGGGAGNTFGFSCAADDSGNVYTTGMFNGPGTFSSMNVSAGGDCFFITKHDPSGAIQWAAAGISPAGFCGNTMSRSIAADQQGNVYILGSFTTGLTIGSSYLSATAVCDADLFMAKYSSSGTLIWVRHIEGTGSQNFASSICTDDADHVYISGITSSDSLSFGNGQVLYSSIPQGGPKQFLAKFDTAGVCHWARSGMGGAAITADAQGNVWVAGTFMGTLTQGTHTVSAFDATDHDIYIAKYDSSGSVLFVRSAGGPNSDAGADIVTDAAGNAYITGHFLLNASFGNFNTAANGMYDVFVAKYDANGNIVWLRTAGGSEQDYGRQIDIDHSGKLLIAGTYNDAITFGSSSVQACSSVMHDVFITRMDTAGNFYWVRTAGGPDIEEVLGLCAGISNDVYVTGGFESNASFGPNSIVSTGGTFNMFVTRVTYEDVVPATGANELHEEAISVYPNPASDELLIKCDGLHEDLTFELLDVCGRLVIKSTLESNALRVDVRGLARGVYFVRVSGNTSRITKKVIVD